MPTLIHIGDSTQSHGQFMTPQSLSVMNTIVSSPENPMPPLDDDEFAIGFFLFGCLSRKSATPNHALQRTATGCHGPCFLRAAVVRYLVAPPSFVALGRGRASPPPSLSLGSLGVSSRYPNE